MGPFFFFFFKRDPPEQIQLTLFDFCPIVRNIYFFAEYGRYGVMCLVSALQVVMQLVRLLPDGHRMKREVDMALDCVSETMTPMHYHLREIIISTYRQVLRFFTPLPEMHLIPLGTEEVLIVFDLLIRSQLITGFVLFCVWHILAAICRPPKCHLKFSQKCPCKKYVLILRHRQDNHTSLLTSRKMI